nr:adhesion G-protein coupled receptor D1-like [Parasteatoda tepidariorum]
MFHVDCLAQICCECSIFIAYMLILLTTTESFRINSSMCLTISIFLHLFFVSASLFLLLEVICMCQLLTTYFPKIIEASVKNVMLIGWSFPVVITGVTAIVCHNQYTTKKNCWLNTDESPYWPTLIPMMVFSCLQIVLILIITVFPSHVSLPEELYKRAKYFRTLSSLFVLRLYSLSKSSESPREPLSSNKRNTITKLRGYLYTGVRN